MEVHQCGHPGPGLHANRVIHSQAPEADRQGRLHVLRFSQPDPHQIRHPLPKRDAQLLWPLACRCPVNRT
jgi:hypothetical protein